MNWTKTKPDFPCIFLARSQLRSGWWYDFYEIVKTDCADSDHYYLAWCDYDGEELDDLKELYAEEYLIIEKTNDKI